MASLFAAIAGVTACFPRLVLAASPPNIIIFQPDDMPFYDSWSPPANPPSKNRKYDLPALPHASRVRSEGLSFTQAYVVSPACAPSRYATLTGRYAARSEYGRSQTLASHSSATRTDTTVPNTKLTGNDCTNNIPSSLKAAGYRTGVAGKWHLMDLGRQTPSYAEQQQSILACGFDWADGIYVTNLDTPSYASSAGGNWSHNMEWVTERGIDFISTTSSAKPFFLYFNPTVPHSPSIESALRDYSCTSTPSGGLATEPSVVGMTRVTTCAAYRSTVISRNTVGTSNQLDRNLGSIWLDDALGALISTLETKGILDTTAIIFMLDHSMETKMALFENGVRTALSIRYPPLFSAGSLYGGHVTNIDLARTILELAGASPGFQMDGVSFLSEIKSATSAGNGASTYWMDRCIFFDYEFDRAVRCGCNKLISIQDAGSTTLVRAKANGYSEDNLQLYNLCSDGSEATNIAASSSGTRADMAAKLDCHTARTNPTGSPSFAACGPSPPDVPTPAPSLASPSPSPSPVPSPGPTPAPIPSQTQPPAPSPSGTCPTGSCQNNAWFSVSLTYQASTGKFSGTLETNQCPFWTQDTVNARTTADCKTVTIGSTTDMPQRGNIGWSVKGVNIYGSFEAGFGNKQTTLENSQATSNSKPPYPCYNSASGRYYGYCDSGVDVASCEESLHVVCSGGDADILSNLFMDRCGGHAKPYHYHNDPSCYYDHTAPGHSPLIGYALDGHGIYGLYEQTNVMPTDLDACNGHTGPVQANSTYGVVAGTAYHYHTTLDFPFTLGCYGPKTLEQCRAADRDCDGKTLSIYTRNGTTKMIDSYCGCRELPSGQSANTLTPSPVPSPAPSPVGSSTLPSPVPSTMPSPLPSPTVTSPSPLPMPSPAPLPTPTVTPSVMPSPLPSPSQSESPASSPSPRPSPTPTPAPFTRLSPSPIPSPFPSPSSSLLPSPSQRRAVQRKLQGNINLGMAKSHGDAIVGVIHKGGASAQRTKDALAKAIASSLASVEKDAVIIIRARIVARVGGRRLQSHALEVDYEIEVPEGTATESVVSQVQNIDTTALKANVSSELATAADTVSELRAVEVLSVEPISSPVVVIETPTPAPMPHVANSPVFVKETAAPAPMPHVASSSAVDASARTCGLLALIMSGLISNL